MKEKMLWVEYLRAIACLMVIVIHVSSEFILKSTLEISWNLANILDSFSRVSVPIFFMISGYLFFGEKIVQKRHYIKVLSALLFYTAIAIFAKISIMVISPTLATKLPLYYNFIAQPSIYHLWYFYPLIVIYLISNLVSVRKINFKTILFIVILLFTFFNPKVNDLLSMIFNYKFVNNFFIQSDTFYFVLYAILGASFNNLKINDNYKGKLMLAVYVVSAIIVALLTSLTRTDKSLPYYSYVGILVFLMSLCLFSGLYLMRDSLKYSNFVSLVSKHSLGIYGIHAFIVSGLSVVTKFYNYSFLIAFPAICVIVFIISLTFSFIIKKVDSKGYVS